MQCAALRTLLNPSATPDPSWATSSRETAGSRIGALDGVRPELVDAAPLPARFKPEGRRCGRTDDRLKQFTDLSICHDTGKGDPEAAPP